MPDYEIRYFHADGMLAVVQMTVQTSDAHAQDYARLNQHDHARFEVRALSDSRPARR